jgi:hypothetical protein
MLTSVVYEDFWGYIDIFFDSGVVPSAAKIMVLYESLRHQSITSSRACIVLHK